MTSPVLKQAYQYIKQGEKNTALKLLEPYISKHPDDVNGWWLMAHATDRPDERRESLEQVLAIDPGYTPAQKMMERLSGGGGAGKRKSSPLPKAKSASKSSKTETIIGIALIVAALFMFACGGIFYAVSRGTNALVQEIAQSVTVEYNSSGSVSNSSGGSGVVFADNMWDVDNNGTIQVGQTKNGRIDDTFTDEGWLFEGRSGQTITVEVNASGGLDPTVTVYAPDGREIAYNDDIELFDNRDSRVTVTLDDSGTYGIVVGSWSDLGGYRLSVR